MPVSFRDLTAGEATAEVVYNGHTIMLRYDPSAVTENAVRDIVRIVRERAASGEASGGMANETLALALASLDDGLLSGEIINMLLCRFLIWWDVLDEDGAMFPLDEERLGDLPLAYRQVCLNAVFGESRMGEATGTPSPARSRATTRTAMRGGSRH